MCECVCLSESVRPAGPLLYLITVTDFIGLPLEHVCF